MSAAPVLLTVRDQLAVVGVVIGVDSVMYGAMEHRVGIAMVSDEILGLRSEKLGGVIPERLEFTAAKYGFF
jgi:hypothetical protein